jgi:hypothetical protein
VQYAAKEHLALPFSNGRRALKTNRKPDKDEPRCTGASVTLFLFDQGHCLFLPTAADEEVIRQVNADNVLSSTWGPGSQSASGSGLPGSHLAAAHPKLLAFKYCCATSPLNHPGRASPFNSARNSPFNSPRGTRQGRAVLCHNMTCCVALC